MIVQSNRIIDYVNSSSKPESSNAHPAKTGNIDKPNSGEEKLWEDEFNFFGEKKVKCMKPIIKKVVVTGLLAWNNSPMLIELLGHVFKHRDFEASHSYVTLNANSVLI